MGGEQAPAEPVDGRDPGPLALSRGAGDLPRPFGLAGVEGGARGGDEPAPNPLPKLARRPLGEREGEDRVGPDAVLGHGFAVALHQDPGLAGARPRLREHVARARLDRRPLLGRGLGRAGRRRVERRRSSGSVPCSVAVARDLLRADRALEPADRLVAAPGRAAAAVRGSVDLAGSHRRNALLGPRLAGVEQLAGPRRARAGRCRRGQGPRWPRFRRPRSRAVVDRPGRRAGGRGRRSARFPTARAGRGRRAGAGACPLRRASPPPRPWSRSCSRGPRRSARPGSRPPGRSGRGSRPHRGRATALRRRGRRRRTLPAAPAEARSRRGPRGPGAARSAPTCGRSGSWSGAGRARVPSLRLPPRAGPPRAAATGRGRPGGECGRRRAARSRGAPAPCGRSSRWSGDRAGARAVAASARGPRTTGRGTRSTARSCPARPDRAARARPAPRGPRAGLGGPPRSAALGQRGRARGRAPRAPPRARRRRGPGRGPASTGPRPPRAPGRAGRGPRPRTATGSPGGPPRRSFASKATGARSGGRRRRGTGSAPRSPGPAARAPRCPGARRRSSPSRGSPVSPPGNSPSWSEATNR